MKVTFGNQTSWFNICSASGIISKIILSSTAFATSYYVATNGSDSNNGISTSTPFQTLQTAESVTKSGDIVYVMSGTYSAPCAGCDVVEICISGTSSAPITYTAYPGTRPIINTSSGWQGFDVDASYITIEGFEIEGDAKSITQTQATNAASNPSYQTAGNGITVQTGLSQTLANG